ncbi:FecR domain-containing protein, partial [Planctomycetota bacterium]
MSRSAPDHYVQSLITELLDGQLTDAQEQELLSLVQSDENVAQWVVTLFADHTLLETLHVLESPEYFVRWVLLHTQYQETGEVFADRVTQAALPDEDLALQNPTHGEDVQRIKEIAERQLRKFMAEQERKRRLERAAQLQEKQVRFNPRQLLMAFNRITSTVARAAVGMAVAAGILLLIVASVQYHRSHRVVATLGETVDARWAEEPTTAQLRPGWLSLDQGYAQLLFTNGAQILLEGPCEFRLDGPKQMTLDGGTLTAQIPPEAVGFTVTTPSSVVTDFGTEFGVAVEDSQDSEVHVFVGEVGVRAKNAPGSTICFLKRGQSALAKISGAFTVGRISSSDKQFVRRLSELEEAVVHVQYLNLADVVGGGNGLGTGQLNGGINPYTGARATSNEMYNAIESPGTFLPVQWNPFVDGVFIPNQYENPMPISQTGLQFQGWPATKNKCFTAIANGARFGVKHGKDHLGILQGQIVGTEVYPAIRMHTNAAITFDLEAIRSAHPDMQVTRFGAYCGISETVKNKSRATFWVLVDGQQVFHTAY